MCRKNLFLILALLFSLCSACRIEHTKTVSEDPYDGKYTEHSVRVDETITDKEHGVEVYRSKIHEDDAGR